MQKKADSFRGWKLSAAFSVLFDICKENLLRYGNLVAVDDVDAAAVDRNGYLGAGLDGELLEQLT